MTDAERPQDVGRSHHRRRRVNGAAATLLTRYQAALRSDLAALLEELEPRQPDPGLGLVKMEPKRLEIAERSRRWDLAIKLARELGAEVDPADAPGPRVTVEPAAPRRRKRVDYG